MKSLFQAFENTVNSAEILKHTEFNDDNDFRRFVDIAVRQKIETKTKIKVLERFLDCSNETGDTDESVKMLEDIIRRDPNIKWQNKVLLREEGVLYVLPGLFVSQVIELDLR